MQWYGIEYSGDPFCQRIQCRHVDAAAKGTGCAEADIVEQDHYNIGRARGRPEFLDRRKFCVPRIERNFTRILVLRIRYRQLRTIDLLRGRRSDPRAQQQAECGSKNQKQPPHLLHSLLPGKFTRDERLGSFRKVRAFCPKRMAYLYRIFGLKLGAWA